jgi:hypothetical protein
MCLDHTEKTIVNGSNMLVEKLSNRVRQGSPREALLWRKRQQAQSNNRQYAEPKIPRACQRVGQTDFAPNNERTNDTGLGRTVKD